MKNLLLIALFICSAALVQAQGFYVQPGISYLSPATSEVLGLKIENSLTPGSEVNGTISGSYGSGLGLDLSLGYMLGRNFGLDLGLSYVIGSKTLTEEATQGSGFDSSYATNRRLTVSPALVIDAGSETLSPFARFGLLVPVAGQTDGLRESNNAVLVVGSVVDLLYPDGVDKFEAESIAKGKFSLGFTASFGLRYQVNEKVSVLGSVGYTGLRIHRNTYEVTRADVTLSDGTIESVLPILSLGGAYGYTEYFEEVDAQELAAHQVAAGENYGSKEFPAWETDQGVNFSTFNLSLGARFSF
mgnify:CR=1 FL=1